MAKTKVSEFDAVASNNTDINSVNVAEGCPPSGINNAIREMASLLKKQEVGTDAMTSPDIDGGTIDGATIGANSASTGAFTNLTVSGAFTSQGIDDNADATAITIDSSENVSMSGTLAVSGATTITTADNTAQLELVSTDADSGIGPHQVFYRNSASPADGDLLCELDFRGRNNNSQDVNYATVNVKANDVSDGTEDGEYILQVMTAGSVDTTMHIKPAEIVFNEDSIDRDFRVESNGNANMLFVDGGNDRVGIGTNAPIDLFSVKGVSGASTDINFSGGDDTNDIRLFFGGDSSPFNGAIVYEPDTNEMSFKTSGIEKMRIDSSGKVGIGTTSSNEPLRVQSDSGTDFDPSSSGFNIALNLKNQTSGANNCISLAMTTETNGEVYLSAVENSDNDAADFVISTRDGGARAERLRLTSDGKLGLGTSSPDRLLVISDGASGSGVDITDAGTTGQIRIGKTFSGTTGAMVFKSNNSTVGTINITNSSTSYNETSDYRLKENVTYDFDATSRLKQLKPARFNFKIDTNITVDGFLAHEVSSIVPEAITGEKDAIDADGNIDPQSIDKSKLVPLLVKTIQELEARITALEGA